ncbi:hypothetical protein GCM10022243_51100 [Saccharothrix violaceirubra]
MHGGGDGPEQPDEIDLLVAEFDDWAVARGFDVDPFVVEAALDSGLERLTRWDSADVEWLLLEWFLRSRTRSPFAAFSGRYRPMRSSTTGTCWR